MSQTTLTKINAPFGWCYVEILNNPNLSLKAKGLWTFIQSKPEGWRFSERRIAQQTADGLASVRSGIQELLDAGLLRRYIEKDANGLVIGSVYELLPPQNHAQACGEGDFSDFDDEDDSEPISCAEPSKNGLKMAQNANTDDYTCQPAAGGSFKGRTAGDEDRAEAAELALELADSIRGNYPDREIKPIKLRVWATELLQLWSKDGHEWEDIRRAIDWSADDDFWKAVVWDVKSLRKNFDKIMAQIDREEHSGWEVLDLDHHGEKNEQ